MDTESEICWPRNFYCSLSQSLQQVQGVTMGKMGGHQKMFL